MRLREALVVAVVAATAVSVAAEAGAGSRSTLAVSGKYSFDTKAKVKNACKPLSEANKTVMVCTTSGVTLVYSGTLQGRGVNSFKEIVNCATGKWYTFGTEMFTGSVAGAGSGKATFGVRASGTVNCTTNAITSVSATEDLLSGTGALAGLYGGFHRGPGTYGGVLQS